MEQINPRLISVFSYGSHYHIIILDTIKHFRLPAILHFNIRLILNTAIGKHIVLK